MEPAPIIIVSGVPGAGKTTVARALAESFDRGAHIEADALQRMIVSGGEWPSLPPAGEGLRQLRLRGTNACLLARSFAEAGFTAVVDDIVIGDRLHEFERDLAGLEVYFIMLTPTLDAVRLRDARREKHAYGEAEHLDPVLRASAEPPGLWLDTSELTVEETVAAIRERLEEGRIWDGG